MITGIDNATIAWCAFSIATGWAGAQIWFTAEKFSAWKTAKATA